MRMLISAHPAGASGVTTLAQITPHTSAWAATCALLTADLNAAIAGAFEGGATQVAVADAHPSGQAVLAESLDARARLHRGAPSPFGMMQGVDDHPAYDAVTLLGYPARAGAKKGVLAHTLHAVVAGVWVNEIPIGTIGLSALLAGGFGLPVVAVSGDNTACLEAQKLLGLNVEVAVVKLGSGQHAAECLPLGDAREKICEAWARAATHLAQHAAPPVWQAGPPLHIEIEFTAPHPTDVAFWLPGTERLSGTRLAVVAAEAVTAYRTVRALVQLAQSAP